MTIWKVTRTPPTVTLKRDGGSTRCTHRRWHNHHLRVRPFCPKEEKKEKKKEKNKGREKEEEKEEKEVKQEEEDEEEQEEG